MCKTDPIRNPDDIRRLKEYFLERGKYRDYAMITLALKASRKEPIKENDVLFRSRNGKNRSIDRTFAFRIIKRAVDELDIEGTISCHSLRKTFGYHAWKKGVPPALIMPIYNHSSIEITKRYLSIDQDDKDEVFRKMNL